MTTRSRPSDRELLIEAHDLICRILLRGALRLDIMPGDELYERIVSWTAEANALGIKYEDDHVHAA